MNGYIAGGIGAGLSQASQNAQQGLIKAYDIKTRRELQAREQSRADLQAQQQAASFEQNSKLKDMQIQQMQMQLKKLTDMNTQRETFDAFRGYRASDGDVKYLNKALNNPEIKKRMKGVNGVYKIDPINDSNLMKSFGISKEDLDSNPGRFVKVTKDGFKPGQFGITDLNVLYAETGYMNTMKKEEIEDLVLKSKQLQTRQQELQVTSAEDWMKANPDKTYQDYLQLGKSKASLNTKANLISEFADLQTLKDKGELPKELESRYKVLKNYAESDTDEKRDILAKGMEITDKYKDKLLDPKTEISKKDIVDAKLFEQQAGIKPDAKSDRELKDQFNVVKNGKRLVEDINNLDDEELSRGLYDTGIQKLKKLLSDKSFESMSKEEKEKTLTSIDMNTKLGMFLAKYIKNISGTAVAEAEYDRLRDLFSGNNFENTQALKQGVTSFVNELSLQLEDGLNTNLLSNTSTVLDLTREYKNLNKNKEVEEKSFIKDPNTGKPTNHYIGEVIEYNGKKYKIVNSNGDLEEAK